MFNLTLTAQQVSVVLKNSKVVVGQLIEENPEHLILHNDLGQIIIKRENISSINYDTFIKMESSLNAITESKLKKDSLQYGSKFVLNDRVVVHLRNGNVAAGLLLAKSLDMIMIQTDIGKLVIPKKDIRLIEYISSEYAERGEIVIVHLTNGNKIEGNIYFEDSDNLTIDSKIGRLTIDKKNLRSIEYTGKIGLAETALVDQYTAMVVGRTLVEPRLDEILLGYAPGFGNDFKPGYKLGYISRFLLSEHKGFYLSALGSLGITYFALNKSQFENQPIPISARGGAVISTISAGGMISVYPQESSFFEFNFAPMVTTHIIFSTLEKNYPSFPSLNSKVTETKVKFGVGTKFGIDINLENFKVGVSYDKHFIFGEESINYLSLSIVKNLF
jgi:small nuclear ribonucleoprotein (snRNP)-like protein